MSFITSPGVIVPPLTAGGVAYGTGGQAKVNSAGTAGQVLTSAGAGVPTWAAVVAGFTLGTPVTASGTSIDFTGVPAGTKQIVVSFSELSISTSWLIRLGDSGGIETSGYTSANTYLANGTTPNNDAIGNGFGVRNFMGYSFTGGVTLTLIDAATFLWGAVGSLSSQSSGQPTVVTTGRKALSSVLTQIRLTTSGGTDNFTSGTVNIAYI
jgi:hypothetical protein